ncbi:hypothetical protein KUTeg_017160 [Tegillarca granosa]|uniref:Glutathione peroxidase n=1 Tax=Tegillarca granosa TaxID=220873 RepID=A0ABQ9ET94_TEGGR|nr:hypothetical protein KUTeg_017160 [Tegillarca granosa]
MNRRCLIRKIDMGVSCSSEAAAKENKDFYKTAKSIHEFSVLDIDGNEVSLDKYKGHVVLILQALHAQYAESNGLRILAFPCNQFGSQEPGTNEEIKKFATEKYGVQFDMFSKINVNGSNADPLYNFLKLKQRGTFGDFIKWNFTKNVQKIFQNIFD